MSRNFKIDAMKYLFFLLGTFVSLNVVAQANANDIVGKWMKMPKEDLVIEVVNNNGSFNGKIQWSGKPDSAQQKGHLVIEDLRYNESSKSWEDGTIHDPRSGSTYKAAAKIKADGTLEVLGYKGMKFIGSKKSFRRIK